MQKNIHRFLQIRARGWQLLQVSLASFFFFFCFLGSCFPSIHPSSFLPSIFPSPRSSHSLIPPLNHPSIHPSLSFIHTSLSFSWLPSHPSFLFVNQTPTQTYFSHFHHSFFCFSFFVNSFIIQVTRYK